MPRQQGLLGAIDSASRTNSAGIPTIPRLQHSIPSHRLSDQDSLLAILDEAIGYLNERDEAISFEQRMPLQRKQ